MGTIFFLAVSLLLVLPSGALAEVVGRLTQVEGRVEVLKGGKLPAVAAKAQDGVEPGDVLRTKSLSRAQITFMDNTTMSLSPESRIAIDEYSFDAAKGKRRAVLQIFQGLAHFVVTQVFKVQEPDFLVKTHTGVMGVRGTDVGIRLSPNDSTFLTFKGWVRVANIFPEVGGAFKKAEKTAYSFGSGAVDLKDMQGSVVARGLPPTMAFTITEEDRQLFMRQLGAGPQGRAGSSDADTYKLSRTDSVANLPDAVSPANANLINTVFNDITIPPTLVPAQQQQQQGPLETFTFSQNFSPGAFSMTSSPTFTQGFFNGSLSVSRSVAYPGTFTATFANLTATTVPPTSIFPSVGDNGSFLVTSNTATVTGRPGGVLVGNMQVNAVAAGLLSTTNFNLSGPVAISPGGGLVFRPGGTFTTTGGSGNVTAGTWIQR